MGDGSPGAHYNLMISGLTDDEWLEVDDLIDLLKAPYDLMKAFEGNDSVGNTVLRVSAHCGRLSSTFRIHGSATM